MFGISFPSYDLRARNDESGKWIFDIVRKKYVKETPEEVVRQYILRYLIEEKGYPKGLLSVEKQLTYNKMERRTDIVAYSRERNPVLLVECKAPEVKITQKVFEQIAVYNMVLQVPYLLVTNGIENYCCTVDHKSNKVDFLDGIPEFEKICE